jgi:hypothetical protein
MSVGGKIDVFIVGAPKCGTTALFKYLGEHPGIYVPDFLYGNAGKTEANHFAPEFLKEGSPMTNRDHYLSFFTGAEPGQILCDASVFHLFSASAPVLIREYNPEAKIIIMLRNPVDFLFSYFQEVRYQGVESVDDFERALDLEEQRMIGGKTSPMLCYRRFAHFSTHIQLYLASFPRDQVLFIKAEDFFRDMRRTYCEVLDFIGLVKWYPEAFTRVNPSKAVRFQWLQNTLHHPPRPIVSFIRRVLGETRSLAVAKTAVKLNRMLNTKNNDNVMDKELAARLREEFRPEVECLTQLTGLDLQDWISD